MFFLPYSLSDPVQIVTMKIIVIVCLFLATFCISSSSCTCNIETVAGLTVPCETVHVQWNKTKGDAVYWSENCDFIGHDISTVPSRNFECGKLCFTDKECTHFTWKKGNCYLKEKETLEQLEDPNKSEGDICGYIPGRD